MISDKESKALPKQKSSLKRKNESGNSGEASFKKIKKDAANSSQIQKKVHFELKNSKKKQGQFVLVSKEKSLNNKGSKIKKISKNKFGKKGKQSINIANKNNKAKHNQEKHEKSKEAVTDNQKKSKLKKDLKHKKLTRVEWKIAKKKSKNDFELYKQAKELGSFIARKDNRKSASNLCERLHKIIKGKVNTLIYAHDTSRVVQSLVRFGSEAIRNELFDEMKGELVKMTKSKYAKFLVKKILEHGTLAQKNVIISSFYGDVVNLMKHTEAAEVVEFAYSQFSKSDQKAKLIAEFYGPTYRLFKDKEIHSLSQLLEENPSQKPTILAYMKENLIPLTEKSVVRHSLVHRVLYEYLTHCQASDKEELIENLRESVVAILHTKFGAKVAMQCIWHGNIRDRKGIIKSFKTHVSKICKEEHGFMVLLAIFDCVDDTVLVKKVILKEIIDNLEDIIFDSHGRKVIMHLLSPRNAVYCHPDMVKMLSQADENPHSKKERDARYNELLSNISMALLNFFVENAEKMIFQPSSNVVAQMIIKHALGDLSNAYTKITDIVAKPFSEFENSKENHITESTLGQFLLKTLLECDKEKKEGRELFCHYLMKNIPEASYKDWINCNRSAFFLVRILETDIPEVVEHYKKVLTPLKGKLKQKSFQGAAILLKKL